MQTASSLNPDFLDVFGFDAGRTREYCDLFAEHGFLVVLPDYFRADFDKKLHSSTILRDGSADMNNFS